jgi:hypothetical protein
MGRQQRADKAAVNKSNSARRQQRPDSQAPSTAGAYERIERERDSLAADLSRALDRIRELEKTQADVHDRIAWALDSLHNILHNKT